MLAPKPAATGTVGIIAPSSPFTDDRLTAGLGVLGRLGYEVVRHPSLGAQLGYLAGDDDTRLAALHDFLADDRIDIIWAARGGYGLHRIVDRIDAQLLRRAQKPIVGFSDVIALHAVAQRRAGLISIHGPVITQLGDLGPRDHEVLAAVLAGRWTDLSYQGDGAVIRGGTASGRILGGCLSVLVPLVGTPLLPPLDGAILLLEDVGEAPYRIDRMLTHLRLAGVLSRVAGVVVGDLVGCEAKRPGDQTPEQVLAERLGDLGVPVLSGLPFGHGTRNHAVPLGARALLDADQRRLTILGP